MRQNDQEITPFTKRVGKKQHAHSAANPLIDLLVEQTTDYLSRHNDTLLELAKNGQKPKWAIVSCIDSRYSGIAVGEIPGERINIANVANIIPPYDNSGAGVHGVSAALEFSVNHLKVNGLLILGHGGCGGINALYNDTPPKEKGYSFITPWMRTVAEAKQTVLEKYGHLPKEEQLQRCEEEAIKISYKNALGFPCVKAGTEKGKLQLYAAHFDPKIGLRVLNPQTMEFELKIKAPEQIQKPIMARL